MVNRKINCPKCKKNDIVKRGSFETKAHGKQQRYYCKSCNRKFIPQTPFYRMRNSSQKITLCLDLFYRGVSTRKIQEHLGAFYTHNSDNSNIYRWIVKYSKQISKFTENLKLSISSEIQIDEVEYHRRKSHKRKLGNEKNWFIDSICPSTKFIVASEYVKSRGTKEIKGVLKKAKKKTGFQIKTITTDGLLSYPSAISKTFMLRKYRILGVKHNVVNASRGDGFNYCIERLHNNLRHRTKNFRGFHGSVASANAILKGWEIYYNFITKHQTINKCPYELATDLKLESNNKWLELIELSS